MKALFQSLWMKVALVVIGFFLFAVLIWFAGPLVEFGDAQPFGGVGARIGSILILLAIILLVVAYRIYRRRAAALKLERAMLTAGSKSDVVSLREGLNDALLTLRQAKGAGRNYLYQIPWYMIIGKPHSGKTTTLINSGLRFPLNAGGTPRPVAGSGSTLYCDWWFTEEAVLIDTAGRYTTQDTDAENDAASWLDFLNLLRTHRPIQPINGVLVAISILDLLTMQKEDLQNYAASLRKRLLELHQILGIDFPIYVLLTKADLVPGFRETFTALTESQRRMVWGATFQAEGKNTKTIGEVPAEFDALIERLNAQLIDRAQAEPSPAARVKIYGLPTQMMALKRPIVDFLNLIFEPTRFHANATLRGFYLTSGTQVGTPLDQLISSIAADLPAQNLQTREPGTGKAFFIRDLLEKIVISEAGWVSTNRSAVRRAALLRTVTLTALGVFTLAIIAIWTISYRNNAQLVSATTDAINEYRVQAQPVLRETVIGDNDLSRILPLLSKLRYLPAGYATRNKSTPDSFRFGLGLTGRLRASAEDLYQVGLERMLRPRLIYRLEGQLEANRENPAFLYDALKVYLMLGGQEKTKRDLILAWMRRDWSENLFPGPMNANGRRALEEHLSAMLDLDGVPVVSLNGPLVEDCQRTLARLSVAERAFEILRSQASLSSSLDWTAARASGPDGALVFEPAGGGDLESLRIPYFYTYDGFQHAFIDKLAAVGEQVAREKWVLGSYGDQAAVQSQYLSLYADLTTLYTRGYIEAWRTALAKIKLRSLTADKPKYIALAAAAAPTSPIEQMFNSIRTETELTHEPGSVVGARAGAVINSLTTKAAKLPGGALAAAAAKSVVPSETVPGSIVESQFKAFQIVVEGAGGKRTIDTLLQTLSDIQQTLTIAADNPSQAAQANAALGPQVASLRGTAARLPQPFADLIRGAADDFEGDISRASASQLKEALNDQVTRPCEQIVNSKYPFSKSGDREVAIGDFGRLFSPNGIVDQFFQRSLAGLVDQSKTPWTWRPTAKIARGFSSDTLVEFQRAATIRDAFFAGGGNLPSVAFTVTPVTLSGDANSAKLEIGASVVESQRGVNTPGAVTWPGGGAERTAITLDMGFFSHALSMEKRGTWSLFRMLDAGSVLSQGQKAIATFIVEGKEVTYEFAAGATTNPLTTQALREFKCPSNL